MGSVEPLIMAPLGSADIVASGLIDSITNNINWAAILFGSFS